MDLGGAENFVMSIYRAIDKNKVQFDFVEHTMQKDTFGGLTYILAFILHLILLSRLNLGRKENG